VLRPFALLSRATLIVLLAAGATAAAEDDFWRASGQQGAVVAGGAEAADAALAMLRRGNAADAAVAALLVLSVTDSRNFCFGGEVPILVYDAKRKAVEVVCGQGTAPALATLKYFQEHKGGRIPGSGDPTTAAVPGPLDACLTMLDRHGTVSFAEAARPALELLQRHETGWQGVRRAVLRPCPAGHDSPRHARSGPARANPGRHHAQEGQLRQPGRMGSPHAQDHRHGVRGRRAVHGPLGRVHAEQRPALLRHARAVRRPVRLRARGGSLSRRIRGGGRAGQRDRGRVSSRRPGRGPKRRRWGVCVRSRPAGRAGIARGGCWWSRRASSRAVGRGVSPTCGRCTRESK